MGEGSEARFKGGAGIASGRLWCVKGGAEGGCRLLGGFLSGEGGSGGWRGRSGGTLGSRNGGNMGSAEKTRCVIGGLGIWRLGSSALECFTGFFRIDISIFPSSTDFAPFLTYGLTFFINTLHASSKKIGK